MCFGVDCERERVYHPDCFCMKNLGFCLKEQKLKPESLRFENQEGK